MSKITNMTILSKLRYVFIPTLLILASISLTRTTVDIVNSSKRLDDLKKDISTLEEEKVDLSKSIEYKNSDAYVEKIARDELNMVKDKEKLFVVKVNNEEKESKVVENNVLSVSIKREKEDLTLANRSENIKSWFRLFF